METRRIQSETPKGKKFLAAFAGIVAAGSTIYAVAHNDGPGDLSKYPEKQVVATSFAPDNTIEGIAVDVNGPMSEEDLYAVENYLMDKENNGSAIIQPGQSFEVPELHIAKQENSNNQSVNPAK